MSRRAGGISRRRMIGGGMGLVAATSVGMPALARHRTLCVRVPNGRLGDGLAEILFPAFTAATGIAVTAPGPGSSTADVALSSRPRLLRAAEIAAPIDLAHVPSADVLDPWFLAGTPVIGLGTMAWFMGLAVGPGVSPPERWADLWSDPRLAGRIAVPRQADSTLLDVVAAVFLGGPAVLSEPDGAAAAIETVAALASRIGPCCDDEASVDRALSNGAAAFGFRRHEPLGGAQTTAIPAEGAPMECAFWCLPSDGAQREAAHAFLDFVAHPATQGLLARRLGVLPVADFIAAGLDVETFAALSARRAIRPNFEAYVCNHDAIQSRWDAMLDSSRNAGCKFSLSPPVNFTVAVNTPMA